MPASNSPVPQATTKTAQSAWEVPKKKIRFDLTKQTGDHVLDEITMARGVNNRDVVLRSLKLPESNVDGDTTLTLSLQLKDEEG
jgi:hypothetical protein